MKVQDSVINARDIQIKELQAKIDALKAEHEQTLIDIAKANSVAQQSAKEADSIADEQLRRLNWKGLHLYGGVEVPKFQFDLMEVNTELMYEFKRFHFGIKGALQPQVDPNSTGFNFNYLLKLRYKFF